MITVIATYDSPTGTWSRNGLMLGNFYDWCNTGGGLDGVPINTLLLDDETKDRIRYFADREQTWVRFIEVEAADFDRYCREYDLAAVDEPEPQIDPSEQSIIDVLISRGYSVKKVDNT